MKYEIPNPSTELLVSLEVGNILLEGLREGLSEEEINKIENTQNT